MGECSDRAPLGRKGKHLVTALDKELAPYADAIERELTRFQAGKRTAESLPEDFHVALGKRFPNATSPALRTIMSVWGGDGKQKYDPRKWIKDGRGPRETARRLVAQLGARGARNLAAFDALRGGPHENAFNLSFFTHGLEAPKSSVLRYVVEGLYTSDEILRVALASLTAMDDRADVKAEFDAVHRQMYAKEHAIAERGIELYSVEEDGSPRRKRRLRPRAK